MRKIDEVAIGEIGIPGIDLMHSAGEAVARIVFQVYSEQSLSGKVGVFSGPGNNGGDGWVCARLLQAKGLPVIVIPATSPESLSGDARTAFEEAVAAGVEFEAYGQCELSGIGLCVDALLGTGSKGQPKGDIAKFVRALATSGLPIIAVDNPTGTDAETGNVEGIAIPAIATVALGLPKIGQFLHPARDFVGRLFVADIGIPRSAQEQCLENPELRIDSPSDIEALLPFRPGDGHKGVFGKTSVIAGSEGMSGAAVFSAEAALRSGIGIAQLIVPQGLVNTVEALFPEVITRCVSQVAKARAFSVRALGEILQACEDSDSVAFGPGIGTHRETVDLTARLLGRIEKPIVIDADGLNCISKLRSKQTRIKFAGKVVITPHPGELSRLLNIPIDEIISNRLNNMPLWAEMLGVNVLLLKGSPTLISSPNAPVYINHSGNDGMATGGSGDLLTGLIAGFIAQGLLPLDAARLGAFAHGLAGDLAANKLGSRGMIARDILHQIPYALKIIEDSRQIKLS